MHKRPRNPSIVKGIGQEDEVRGPGNFLMWGTIVEYFFKVCRNRNQFSADVRSQSRKHRKILAALGKNLTPITIPTRWIGKAVIKLMAFPDAKNVSCILYVG
jgi:hypothetical protein